VPAGTRAFEFSTDKYREHERIAAWREVFGHTLLKIDVSPLSPDGFHARARILQSPGIASFAPGWPRPIWRIPAP